MPNPAYWRCSSCSRQLGQVRKDGSLEILAGSRTIVPSTTTAETVIIVVCAGCGGQRRWAPHPPAFEIKTG